MIVWLNGTFFDDQEAGIPVMDRGFLLGDGLFETLSAHHGQPVFWEDHAARLVRDSKKLAIPLPFSTQVLKQAGVGLLARNALQEKASLRLTLTRGPAPRGIIPPQNATPTVLMTAAARSSTRPPPLRLVTSPIRRNATSPAARIKTLNYLDNILARQDAHARNADDALMLNTHGNAACTSTGNIFLWDGEIWRTPPPQDGILEGITRSKISDLAKSRGIPVLEASVSETRLPFVRAAFVTNSLAGVQPVLSLDGHRLERPPALDILDTLYEAHANARTPD